MTILSGCTTTSYKNCKIVQLDLPTMPVAGPKVANELKLVCDPWDSCYNLNNWLNELYLFKLQYEIYQKSS